MFKREKRCTLTIVLLLMLALLIMPQICHAWPFDITLGTPFEFNQNGGWYPALSEIDDTHYLCTYVGVGSTSLTGLAVVLAVDINSGTVDIAGTPFEFVAEEIEDPALFKIDDTHFLCAYTKRADSDGWSVVLTVDTSDWSITMETPFEFDPERALDIALSEIDDTHCLCAYYGGNGGVSVVLTIDSSDWTITKETPSVLDANGAHDVELFGIDDTHYLCGYRGGDNKGYSVVLTLDTGNWTITKETPFVFSTSYTSDPALSMIDNAHYLCAYRGGDNEGTSVVLTLDTGNWTITKETPFVFDSGYGGLPVLSIIDDTHFLCGYINGNNNQIWSVVLTVDSSNWAITKETPSMVDTGYNIALSRIDDDGHYLCAYHGPSGDGWAVVINVELPEEPGILAGYVTELSGGDPLADAVVTCHGFFTGSDTSDTNGYYEITDLYAGTYDSVTCVHPHYNIGKSENIEIFVGETTPLDFEMTAPEMEIDPFTIDEELQPDETLTAYITVNNNGNGALAFNVDIETASKEDKAEFDVSLKENHRQCGDDCASITSDISGWHTPAHRPESKTNRLNEWYTYGDINSISWITWATPERVTYFDPSDFSLTYPFAITKLSHWFYEDSSYPWDDATFRFKIYAGDGVTLLYESGDIEAQSAVEMVHDMTEPVNIQAGGFYFGVAPVSSSGYPSSIADELYTGSNHSYYGSAGSWQLWSESPDKGEFVQSVYLTGVVTPWIIVDPTSGIVEAGDSTEVAVTLDATGLESGTTKTADLIFTPYPDVGEQIVNVFLTIPSPNYGYISGNVTLEQGPYSTGDVRDVLITAGSDTIHPGISGFYRIYVPGGDYNVIASLYGYEDAIYEDVTVVAGEETTDIDFDLSCLLGGLSGYVTDFDSGNPVEGATVTVLDSRPNEDLFDTTDENGFYEIGDITEGQYAVETTHSNYITNTVHDVETVQGICSTQDIVLQQDIGLIPPKNLIASNDLANGVEISWKSPAATLLELSQHDGIPVNAYYQSFDNGYGVVFDLDAYPDATLEMIDFRHSPWGLSGTWEYAIHIVDWDTYTEITEIPNLYTTGNDKWELEISLGSIVSSGGLVGVLIQPQGNVSNDAYPCLDFDTALDGYSVVAPVSDFGNNALVDGDYLIDLWISTAYGKKLVTPEKVKIEDIAHHRARKEVHSSLESGEFITIHQSKSMQNRNRDFLGMYNLYRSSNSGIPYEELIAEEITDTVYTDTTVSPDEVWYYAATALYDAGESPYSNEDSGELGLDIEYVYDDGTAETGYSGGAGTYLAVHISPDTYPVKVVKVEYYLTSVTQQIIVRIWDDDGTDGLPGTQLVVPPLVIPTSQLVPNDWNVITLPDDYNIKFTNGDFYVGWMEPSNSSLIGVDTNGPSYNRSYQYANGVWYDYNAGIPQNLMMRAIVQPTQISVDEDVPTPIPSLANYPNPVRTSTTFYYNLKAHMNKEVEIRIYNVRGQLVDSVTGKNGEVLWTPLKNLGSGIYFYKIESKDKSPIKKMILMR